MAMQAESLETLEKASVGPEQARAIVRAIEIEIAGAKDTLATKNDILMLQQRIDSLGAELRGELSGRVSELNGSTGSLAGQLRAEMATLTAELRTEMTTLAAGLRTEMATLAAGLRTELAKQIGDLRAEISGVTRQMYVALLGQTAVMLGFFYFFITELR
jgi:hypothetical protein